MTNFGTILAAVLLTALVAPAVAGPAGVRAGIEAWQKGDHSAAVAAWRPLAATGDADAAFNLGQAYRLGKGVPIDMARAQDLFEQAARSGHVDAATTLGVLLFQNGNRSGAMRWLQQSAEAGEARAMLLYGTALYNGDGIESDAITAYAYVSRAAAQGLGAARATLADLDAALSLSQRQEGVAKARAMVGGKRPVANAVAAVPAPARAPVRPQASTKPKLETAPASGAWRIQLGAFGQRGAAEALFARLEGKLGGRRAFYIPVGSVVRLQAGPYSSRAEASAACARLAGQACFVVAAR